MTGRPSAWLLAAVLLGCVADLHTQIPRPAPPPGNRILAHDGDTIVVEHDARVTLVRRRDANVRAIFNRAERWLVLLLDYAVDGAEPDGSVDATHAVTGLSGDWPMQDRWEGTAVVEEYSDPGGMSSGVGLAGPRGLVQILTTPQLKPFRDPDAIAVMSFSGSRTSRGTHGLQKGFDEVERSIVEQVRRDAGRQGQRAVRVGGSVSLPEKIVDVRPVTPEQAVRAGITGVVILEITIDTEGAVKEARVLRSIPMLDRAALDAVRQWRFTPTTLDGQPVPVIMTVTVPFP